MKRVRQLRVTEYRLPAGALVILAAGPPVGAAGYGLSFVVPPVRSLGAAACKVAHNELSFNRFVSGQPAGKRPVIPV